MVDHIVDLVQPLTRIAFQRVLCHEILRGRAAELARQDLFHLQKNLLRIRTQEGY
jgi:hypothetical protein